MSNEYQAIYDAIRSKINGADVGAIFSQEISRLFDISHITPIILQEFCISAAEARRPFVLLKPRIYPDGDQWCALYGDNLQEGVCAFGDTPEIAAQNFDVEWQSAKIKR